MAGPPASSVWGPVAFVTRRAGQMLSDILKARMVELDVRDQPQGLAFAMHAASRESSRCSLLPARARRPLDARARAHRAAYRPARSTPPGSSTLTVATGSGSLAGPSTCSPFPHTDALRSPGAGVDRHRRIEPAQRVVGPYGDVVGVVPSTEMRVQERLRKS